MTTPVFPSSVITEFHNGSTWVDISQYVVSDILGDGGFLSSDPSSFTAGLGTSTFDLNNSGGLFTVYGGDSVRGLNTLSGWQRGAKIRHRVIYDGHDKVVWLGFVGDVKSDAGTWGDQRVHVSCVDWLDVASRYPMKRSEILLNQTLADGAQSLVNRISVAPEGLNSDTSSTTFPSIFDNVKSQTKALAELDKLARSEMGFVYVLKDGVLKVEGSTSRKGTSSLSQVPVVSGNALLVATDNALLVSADNALLISEMEEANLSLDAEKLDLTMGGEHWNDAYVRGYPTVTDTSLKVLFQIGSSIPLACGVTVELIGNYSDPNGGKPVNGTNMQTPVATTDFLFNTAADGSGTNITASGTVTADYYGDVVVYRLNSSYLSTAYITKLQARGYGIYRNSYFENHISITGSALAYGEKTFDLDQRYQTDPYAGLVYGNSIMELYKTPKTRVISAGYNANLNSSHMLAFMYLDIGSLIKVYDNRSNMYKWYHITSRKFTILLGGIILVLFGLSEHVSLTSGGLNSVALEFNGTGTSDGVNFGYLPHVSGLGVTERTFSAWIYQHTDAPSSPNEYVILSTFGDTRGILFYTRSNHRLFFFSDDFSTIPGGGRWETPTGTFALNTWTHVAASFVSNDINANPVVYVNGVQQSLTKTLSFLGTYEGEVGRPLVIGNMRSQVTNYTQAFDGLIKDVRVYNQILTQAEILEIYNGGVQDYSVATDGLVFQAFTISSDLGDASSLNGQEIPVGNKYFDNILRCAGEPHGAPIIRSTP